MSFVEDSDRLEVLAELVPERATILSVVTREHGPVPFARPGDNLYKGYRAANLLAVVDGDEYVVSFGDRPIDQDKVALEAYHAATSDIYATNDPDSVEWLETAGKKSLILRRHRPLFEGHVAITSRDAFDAGESHYTRGMIGYTLRNETKGILHTTGVMPDDPEFFIRTVAAADPTDVINWQSHFTTKEEQDHDEIYGLILGRMHHLIKEDGLPAEQALYRYLDQTDVDDDISRKIAAVLTTGADCEPLNDYTGIDSLYASYTLGEKGHLLIHRMEKNGHYYFEMIRHYIDDQGEAVVRRYMQDWGEPNLIQVNRPQKNIANFDRHDRRLFLLDHGDALELNAILTALQ